MILAFSRTLRFVLLAAVACAVPCLGEIYFQTSWNLTTGNSVVAATDGYTFNGSHSTGMLNVEHGGVAGNNLFGIWLQGQAWAGVWAQGLPIDKYDDFYYRFYIRVYPKNGMTYYAFHGIQNADQGPGSESNFYFSVKDFGSPNGWQCAIGTYTQQQGGMDQYGYAYRGDLHFNEWYRVEGRIHWYGHGNSAPVKWEIRLYNASNALVLDEDDFTGFTTGATLKSEYAGGKQMTIDGTTNSWFMGNNGPGGGTGSARFHDISCLALGNDASVWGPVTGLLSAEKIKPFVSQTFPANNATNVATIAKTWVTLQDAGLGLDTSSIVMKVNGSVVARKLLGTLWSSQVSYQPAAGFPAGNKVTVEINAKDVANPPNVMGPYVYSFTTAGTPSIVPKTALIAGQPGLGRDVYTIFGRRINSDVLVPGKQSGAGAQWIAIQNGKGAKREIRMER